MSWSLLLLQERERITDGKCVTVTNALVVELETLTYTLEDVRMDVFE